MREGKKSEGRGLLKPPPPDRIGLMSRSMGSHDNILYGFTLYMKLFLIKFHYFDDYKQLLKFHSIEMSPSLLIS